jgi:hypothetical protein
MRDGTRRTETVSHHKGTSLNPVTKADLLSKFTECVKGRFPDHMAVDLSEILCHPGANIDDMLRLLGERD